VILPSQFIAAGIAVFAVQVVSAAIAIIPRSKTKFPSPKLEMG
jgi:hypothetical protein